MKKVLSLALALVLTASLSSMVFGADYGGGGGGGSDGSDSSSSNNTNNNTNTTTTTTPSVVSPATVTTALNTAAPTVSITSNSVLTQAVVQEIAKATAPVTFNAANYTIVIDPKTVTAVADLNLGVATTAPAAQATFENYYANHIATVAMAQNTTFGATLQLTVVPDAINKLDLTKTIYAYAYNPANNTFALLGNPTVANGKLTLSITAGTTIIFSEGTLARK